MAGRRRWAGGILGLLDLIDEHRGALDYDFRARFPGLSNGVASMPDEVGWDEGIRLVRILGGDPSSQIAAAMNEWPHPVSHTDVILMDLWDMTAAAAHAGSKKQPPKYPRVWKVKGDTFRRGNAAGRTPEQVMAILREQFGQPEAPV